MLIGSSYQQDVNEELSSRPSPTLRTFQPSLHEVTSKMHNSDVFLIKFVNAIFLKFAFWRISNSKILAEQKSKTNLKMKLFLSPFKPYNSTNNFKSKRKQKFQTHLTWNCGFVFTN